MPPWVTLKTHDTTPRPDAVACLRGGPFVSRHRAAAGPGYSIEESGDLQHWNPSPRLALQAPVQDHGEIQQIRIPVRSSGSLAEAGGFFRLNLLP
jgi:hypothetical protein